MKKNLIFQVAIGDSDIYETSKKSVKEYAEKIGAAYICHTNTSFDYPFLEKLNVKKYLKEYRQVLYLDSDILINNNAPNIFEKFSDTSKFYIFNEGFYLDRMESISNYSSLFNFSKWKKDQGGNIKYYNTGVMLMSKKHKKIFDSFDINLFCSNPKMMDFYEQTYINYLIAKKKIKVFDLPIKFNHMSSYSWGERSNSYFIHYAGFGAKKCNCFNCFQSGIANKMHVLHDFEKINGNEMLDFRDNIWKVLDKNKLYGKGVEIGVQEGNFSEILAPHLKELTLVDPWAHLDDYIEMSNLNDSVQEVYYERVINKFKDNESVKIKRTISKEAVKDFEDNELDFVYIDANHDYEHCKEDIELWYPKVKSGGLVAGHDYMNEETPAGTFHVKKAVDEFASKNNYKVNFTAEAWPTWYFIKR